MPNNFNIHPFGHPLNNPLRYNLEVTNRFAPLHSLDEVDLPILARVFRECSISTSYPTPPIIKDPGHEGVFIYEVRNANDKTLKLVAPHFLPPVDADMGMTTSEQAQKVLLNKLPQLGPGTSGSDGGVTPVSIVTIGEEHRAGSVVTHGTQESFVKGRARVVFWNISGLRSKTINPIWVDFIKNVDILCLQETWSLEEIHLSGFKTFHVPAGYSSHGRNKGGICVYVTNLLGAVGIKMVKASSYYEIIVIKMSSLVELTIINMYNNLDKGQVCDMLRDSTRTLRV